MNKVSDLDNGVIGEKIMLGRRGKKDVVGK